MSLSHIVKILNQICESIGLPPIVLICTIALFFFIFVFGLLILIKVRSIKKNMIIINRNFNTLNQRIQEGMASLKAEKLNRDKDNINSKSEPHKQAETKSIKDRSNDLFQFADFDDQNISRDKNGSDIREEEFFDTYKGNSDIKSEILSLLKITNGPMSYSEIAKHLSKDSSDYNFESILEEMDLLKNEGKVIGQIFSGKIYFQIKK